MLEFINTESDTKTHHNGNTYHLYSTMHFLTAHRSLYETVLKGLKIENHITNHIEQRQCSGIFANLVEFAVIECCY